MEFETATTIALVASGAYGLRSAFNSNIKKLPRLVGAFATATAAIPLAGMATVTGPEGLVVMGAIVTLGPTSIASATFCAGAAYQSYGTRRNQVRTYD